MPGPPVTQATSLGAAMAAPVAQNVAKFDPETGQPVAKMRGKFDPYTGQPLPKFDPATGAQNW